MKLHIIYISIWINLKNITLCKRSHSQSTTYCIISFILNVQKRHILYRYEVDWCFPRAMPGTRVCFRKNGEFLLMGMEFGERKIKMS
jgi:hypothetical protein